ncbi:low molecular weight protein-tyrosine-phosphatase [Lutimaribacter saemankumensis]|uniref:protein-tyrosine-phosphatase n=1 Tax=Lutimaribacter saemankumensis TaxID=490829 RepID=A0A1G8MAY1_9RHOB|nr:low molecular weight protein-tyrosine-phosphatase [Lutimaribacter saemankumensis]SDI64550.1 protein-tyrosine phosphatase [Lutimaribacter saemankumensis]
MSKRILFVCLGNICRSPSAHAVTRSLAPDWTVDSAGTSDWHVGEPPYGPMQAAARARGIAMDDLRARQFHADDFDLFDLIVAMDADNLARIESQRPAGNATPVRLFTDFDGVGAGDHVPDPYYTRDFDGCLDLIETCARGLIETD